MFKNFNENSLSQKDYAKKNKEAQSGFKFCNGMCLTYLPIDDFFDNKNNCKDCYYLFLKVKKMVDNNQITYEKFKENPNSVQSDKTTIPMKRLCKTCNEEKTLEHFEETRKECIICRRKKKKTNYEEQFKECLPAIEKAKTDIEAIKNLLRSISSDLVKLALAHYKIPKDPKNQTKANMIVKLVDYFQSQLNPKICLGGCGFELETEFSVCDYCKKKPKNLREQKEVDFEANLDTYMAELDDFTDETANKLTKTQCVLIAKRLNIQFYVSNKRYVIVDKIKAYFEEKKKKETALVPVSEKKDLSGTITLNSVVIYSREDGMINATALCKAGGKEFKHWMELKSTKELIKAKEEDLNSEQTEKSETGIPVTKMTTKKSEVVIPTSQIIDVHKGNSSKYQQGSWIHPDLAGILATWISPKFAIKVGRWIRELASTGSVVLGKEKTEAELLEIQRNYKLLQKDHKKLETNHRKLLQKKTYHKFKTGPAFYIISDLESKELKFKPGFEGCDITRRLQEHRSSIPGCKLEFLVYSDNAKLIETLVLNCFDSKRKLKNHEWLYDLTVETIIRQVRAMLNVCNIKYTEEPDLYCYNEKIEEDVTEN